MYPADKNLVIKTDVGTVIKKSTVSQTITREAISFSGKEASAAFAIEGINSFTGYFFDGLGNVITPSFSVVAGGLVASVDCYGTGYLSYTTSGTVYDYNADIQGTVTSIGTVFAFDPKNKGIAASYAIPTLVEVGGDREDMLTVYRETIAQNSNTFERPENWATDNSYANYGSALEDDKPVVGDAYAVVQWNHEVVFVQNGATFTDKPGVRWYKPTTGEPFNGVVYKLARNIPSSPTETIDQDLIDVLTAKEAELKTFYGIV